MTDATPDPLTDETPSAPDEGPEYVVTPTLRAFSELVERVEHLEADTAALPSDAAADGEDEVEDLQTQQRLTRHRTEIEEIKRTLNLLIEYLTVPGSPLPAAVPPAPVAAPATTDMTTGATP